MKNKQFCILILLCALVFLNGRTIIIPDDFSTIQQGINNSADSDTVLVNPGTYYENIDFTGKNIVLGSLFLTTGDTSYISQTIIDGNASGSVVTFENGERSEAKLIGFTLTNGYASKGAGILIQNSHPEISANIITKNRSQHIHDYDTYTCGIGAGLYLINSGADIINNQIINNYGALEGGGIYISNSDGINIIDNVISFNSTENYWANLTRGGGMYITNSTNIIINHCIFSENYVTSDHYADQIYSSSSGVIISKCTFYNSGKNRPSYMFLLYNGVSISNSIIWHGDNFPGSIFTSTSNPEITYSNIRNWHGGTNNISADPLFENFTDFRLKLQSPCINKGDPLHEADPDGTVTDMGRMSYNLEGYGSVSGIVSLDDGARTLGNIYIRAGDELSIPISSGEYAINLLPGNYPVSAHLSPKVSSIVNDIPVISGQTTTGIDFHLPNDSSNYRIVVAKDEGGNFNNISEAVKNAVSGDSIIITDGIYNESISLINKSLTVASLFLMNNDSTHIENTIIDGEGQRQPIFIDSTEVEIKISGLTIQNGSSEFGGACYTRFSNVDFSNCIFMNNRANNSGGALYSLFSKVNITDCSFKENYASTGGALCNIISEMSILRSFITQNEASLYCGAIYSDDSSLDLLNSDITYNTADQYGGVWSRYPERDYYANNRIIGNSARFGGGLSFEHNGENSFVVNNLITENHSTIYGGGIYCAKSSTTFINNTIVKNSSEGKGGGINIYSASPVLYNNIFWNNTSSEGDQIAVGRADSFPVFHYSDIQGGKQNVHYFLSAVAIPDSNYVNNIDSDPLFLDEWNGDYFLTENSPCINAGTELLPEGISLPEFDLTGNPRIYGSTVDIGAYEWQGVGIEDSSIPVTTRLYQNYPNPFNPVTTITYSLSSAAEVELNVYNMNGQIVKSLVNGKLNRGVHKAVFNAEYLTSGLYIYKLKVDGKSVQSRKMMLLK